MGLPKLLDCPFCGGIPTLAENRISTPTEWLVVCTFCGGSVKGPIDLYLTKEEAARAWNTRGGIYIDPDK